jgi:hypothetical protein
MARFITPDMLAQLLLTTLIFTPAVGLGAQGPAAPGSGARTPAMQEDYRLEVKLTGGRTLTGFTRNGRLHEKRVAAPAGIGRRFIPAEAGDPAAGLRLWNVGDLGGFIFLARDEIVSVKKTGAMAAGELDRLDRAAAEDRAASRATIMKAWRSYRAASEAKARSRREAKRKREAAEARRKLESPPTTLSENEMGDLLFEFHPNLGWTPGYRDVIEWRETVFGCPPDPDERRWLAHYPEWMAAWNWWTRVAIPVPKPEML